MDLNGLAGVQKDIILEHDFYRSLKDLGFVYKQNHIELTPVLKSKKGVCYGVETHYNEDLKIQLTFINFKHRHISDVNLIYDYIVGVGDKITLQDYLTQIKTIMRIKLIELEKIVDKYKVL